MSSRTSLPPILEPYLTDHREHSLTLVTSVLGASSNWLVLQYLASLLRTSKQARQRAATDENAQPATTGNGEVVETAVVLVSWLRDWKFWEAEARRSVGLDLSRLAQQDRFVLIDGLTELYQSAYDTTNPTPPSASLSASPSSPARPSPGGIKRGPLPVRQGATPQAAPLDASPTPSLNERKSTGSDHQQMLYLTSPDLNSLNTAIQAALTRLAGPNGTGMPRRRVVLVLDGPDYLLASASPESGITASSFFSALLGIQSMFYSSIITVAADSPFLRPNSTDVDRNERWPVAPTPLESGHTFLVTSLAHQARRVMGLRMLDTGTAKDVSGVLRISLGGNGDDVDGEEEPHKGGKREQEVLYFVSNDGIARVFDRGSEVG